MRVCRKRREQFPFPEVDQKGQPFVKGYDVFVEFAGAPLIQAFRNIVALLVVEVGHGCVFSFDGKCFPQGLALDLYEGHVAPVFLILYQ